jgi:hypothetical protein
MPITAICHAVQALESRDPADGRLLLQVVRHLAW